MLRRVINVIRYCSLINLNLNFDYCNKSQVFQSWAKRHKKTIAARVWFLLQEMNKIWPSAISISSAVEDVEERRTGSDVNVPISCVPPTNLGVFHF